MAAWDPPETGLWRPVLDSILSALLAPPCAACGAVLDQPLSGAVCPACWTAIVPVTPPLCRACGDPLPSWRVASIGEGLCPRCRRGQRIIVRGRAVGAYDGTLRTIIHALKYGGRRSAAPKLAALMARHGVDVLAGADAVVPVPLHPRRERERGFNQAYDLADRLGLPLLPALTRVRSTRPQVDLPAAQRHRNVRDAFALARGTARVPPLRRLAWAEVPPLHGKNLPLLHDKIVVLVDDVSTTGATLEACARVLKDGGAAEVRALTAARVVSARP